MHCSSNIDYIYLVEIIQLAIDSAANGVQLIVIISLQLKSYILKDAITRESVVKKKKLKLFQQKLNLAI